MKNRLYIGNKSYSSWSLRPWLCLRWAGIPFEEVELRLDRPGYGEHAIVEVLAVSPNGRVPCLHTDGLVIWDSLAIAEWAAEERPDAGLWPADRALRAQARSATAEMHSGFAEIRSDLPMNIPRRCRIDTLRRETQAEIASVDRLWSGLRERHGDKGPWLFGQRSIADAFYAPLATRMRTYDIALSPAAQSWCDTILADADFREWEADCQPNSWDSAGYPVIDALYA